MIAFAQFSGRIDNQFLAHGLLEFTLIHPFISKIVKSSPIKKYAMLVFTNGSTGRSHLHRLLIKRNS